MLLRIHSKSALTGLLVLLWGWGDSALAQRADENAIVTASDAFGLSLGRDTIGLYRATSVRGFSANAAGNARIDGLFFDPVWSPTARIRQATSIRVGVAAQAAAFPAPTGIVDHALRKPGERTSISLFASADTYGGVDLEIDLDHPLAPNLKLAGGVGLYRNSFQNGTEGYQHIEGAVIDWSPSDAIGVRGFWSRSDVYDDEFGPLYVPAGPSLPPPRKRREYEGPQKPKYRSTAHLYGVTMESRPGSHLNIKAGLFRTLFDDHRTATNLLLDLQPDGAARQVLFVDPPSVLASTSGEILARYMISGGSLSHSLTASLRGRIRTDRYGGAAVVDLGPTRVGRSVMPISGPFGFGAQTRDEVRQVTGGLSYALGWRSGGMTAFVQHTDYRKLVRPPGAPAAKTTADPILFGVNLAQALTSELTLYGGHTRGLEESGVAPDSAVNRGEALAAIRTTQTDAGVRWAVRPGLKLVAGAFDVRKPYFNQDTVGLFRDLGAVRHAGLEASLSGQLADDLDLVIGGVLLRPRVRGEAVDAGRVGSRPVGQVSRTLQASLDWRPAGSERLSLDMTVAHVSSRTSRADNLADLPPLTLVDLGGRYRLRLADRNAVLRVTVTNAFNVAAFELKGAGTYDINAGRVFGVSLGVDY